LAAEALQFSDFTLSMLLANVSYDLIMVYTFGYSTGSYFENFPKNDDLFILYSVF
jgi:hypothetical protein